MSSDFAHVRARYNDPSDPFDIVDLASKNPIKQFDVWFKEARNNPNIKEANWMCLSTATKEGKPSGRIVLLKDYSDEGFSFFTNYQSRKGLELQENPQASLTFYWDALSRQVRIEGKVIKVEREKSAEYFSSRPLNSKISGFISNQSKVVENRKILTDAHKDAAAKFETYGNVVPTPEFWGGYLVVPDEIEFWRGNDIRLHDRLRFRRVHEGEDLSNNSIVVGENGWLVERLSP